jgi:hypothetical protein
MTALLARNSALASHPPLACPVVSADLPVLVHVPWQVSERVPIRRASKRRGGFEVTRALSDYRQSISCEKK